MFDPYAPPKAEIVTQQSRATVNRYYRAANWIYGLFLVIVSIFLIAAGTINLDAVAALVIGFFVAPVVGYLLSIPSKKSSYKVWHIIHWIVVAILLLFVADDILKAKHTPVVGWFLLAVNLLSVLTNHYFRRQGISVDVRNC